MEPGIATNRNVSNSDKHEMPSNAERARKRQTTGVRQVYRSSTAKADAEMEHANDENK